MESEFNRPNSVSNYLFEVDVNMASKKPKTDKTFGPLDEDYWRTPHIDRARHGDPDPTGIYLAVGITLTAWELVEETTASMFLTLAGGDDARAANILARVFGAISTHSARWSAIEAVLEVNFGSYWTLPIGRAKFSAVKRAVLAASRRRNQIAHGRVLDHSMGTADGTIHIGAFLTAPDYDTDRNSWLIAGTGDVIGYNRSDYRYNAEDILDLARKYEALNIALREFGTDNSIDTRTWLSRSIIRHLGEQK